VASSLAVQVSLSLFDSAEVAAANERRPAGAADMPQMEEAKRQVVGHALRARWRDAPEDAD
jgi:hypothetical protein